MTIATGINKIGAKLGRAGLKAYARFQRCVTNDKGERYFSYEPDSAEMAEARRLAEKFGVKAVIVGHSHAARWKLENDLLYANTGTWIWLMRLPDEDAGADEWNDFLRDLQDDPKLESDKNQDKLEKRFTWVTVSPEDEGATIALYALEEGEPKLVNTTKVAS